MKFLLDIVILVVLFMVFRRAMQMLFPKKEQRLEVSQESQKALNHYRNRYFIIFIALSILISLISYALMYYLGQYIFTAASFNGLYYGLAPEAYMQSAILFAVLSSVFISPLVNNRMQVDGLAFYLAELEEHIQGYRVRGAKLYLTSFGFILLVFLMIAQVRTFFVVNEVEGRVVQGFTKDYRFKIADITEINNNKELYLVINNQDTILMGVFDYNEAELYKFINKNTSK